MLQKKDLNKIHEGRGKLIGGISNVYNKKEQAQYQESIKDAAYQRQEIQYKDDYNLAKHASNNAALILS